MRAFNGTHEAHIFRISTCFLCGMLNPCMTVASVFKIRDLKKHALILKVDLTVGSTNCTLRCRFAQTKRK